MVETTGLDFDHDISNSGGGPRYILDSELLYTTMLVKDDRAH
jgi:hypothetical protein